MDIDKRNDLFGKLVSDRYKLI